MAKFLVSTMPATGHINPALPVAAALVNRGHEVWWHTGTEYAEKVKATGAHFVPFDRAPDFTEIPVIPDPGAKGPAAAVSVLRRLFIDRIPGQVADYESILSDFSADALIADMCSLGAATLRDRGGPVYATLGINPLVTADPEIPPFGSHRPPASSTMGRIRNRLAHAMGRIFMRKPTALLNAVRADLGLTPLPPGKDMSDVLRSPFLHIMPTTEAFEYPRRNLEPQVHFVGPLLPAPSSHFEPPNWWNDLTGKRVVHVTQGTVATDPNALVRPTIEALASEDVLLVVTSPNPVALGTLPGNVRTAEFIPHAALLPHVNAMVTNAGYNGVLTALAHGVPLVCAGLSEDKANVSARVAWSRAGIDLKTDRPSPQQLRDAIRRVLGDPAYRHNAARIRDDFARHRPSGEATALLERLAESKAPVFRDAISRDPDETGRITGCSRPLTRAAETK